MNKPNITAIFCCLLFCFSQASASGQELLSRIRATCTQNKAPSSVDPQIVLKAYPLRPLNVSLTANQNSILDSMIEIDAAAVAIERARRPIPKTKPEGESRFPYFDSSDAPDSVVVIRKNVATVFPKMLLFSPIVASKKLEPNDLVATFYAKPNSGADTDDLIQKWFKKATDFDSENSFEVKSVEVATTGKILKSKFKRTWNVVSGGGFRELLYDSKELLHLESDADAKELDSRMNIGEESLDAKLVVAILHRNAKPYNVRIVVPIKNAGNFGENGKEFMRLFDKKEGSSNQWETEFSPYLNLDLADSDIVEITTMDLLRF